MSEWKKTRLGEICLPDGIQTGPFGSQLHQRDYSEAGTPVIMPKDIHDGTISEEGIARVSQEHVRRLKRHKVNENDIIYPRRGDVGKSAFITNRETGWLCGTGCLKVSIDAAKALPRYVHLYLSLVDSVKWIENHSVGATMPNINSDILANVPIALPSLPIQDRIAGILSDYDAAIANCRKQIALLEEAAMRIYKEWFKDGKGERKRIGDVIDEIESGSRPRGGAQQSGVPSIGAEKIDGIGRYDYNGEKFISEEYFAKMNRGKIQDEDILLYKDGAYCGKVSMVLDGHPHAKAAVNEHVFILRAYGKTAFIYCFLRQPQSYALLNQLACKKAAQPGLNQQDVMGVEISMPKVGLCEFEETVMPFMHMIAGLANQIRSLTEARDRLLPKLMKGEIAV